MEKKKFLLALLGIVFLMRTATAQIQFSFGPILPTPSGVSFDLQDPNSGSLFNRVALTSTTDATTIATPPTSLWVYNTATASSGATAVKPGYYFNSGTSASPVWTRLYGQTDAWSTTGNYGTTASTSPITVIANNNFLGNIDGKDLPFVTSGFERMRIKADGSIGIGTITTTANTLLTINPTTNAFRNGIDMTLTGATSSATGLNISTGNANVNGITVTHSSSSTSSSLYGIGSILSSTRIVSGYLGYRTGSGNSYGVFGVTGTIGTPLFTDANTWAAFFKGRTVISSEGAPTSPIGVDLEVRNTTSGSGNPATLSLRQDVSNSTSGSLLANLNFGDNYTTTPQAQLQVVRGAAGGAGDLATDMIFSNIADNTATLTERLRIKNGGAIAVNGAANTGTNGQVLTSTGSTTAPTWQTPAPPVINKEVFNITGEVYDPTGAYSTTSTTWVTITGASLTLSAGTYLITAQAEVQNATTTYGTYISLYDGTNYYGISNPASYSSTLWTWSPWTCTKEVTIASSTTYLVRTEASSSTATAYARNVRIYATKVQ